MGAGGGSSLQVSQENKLLSEYYQESLGMNSSMQDTNVVSCN